MPGSMQRSAGPVESSGWWCRKRGMTSSSGSLFSAAVMPALRSIGFGVTAARQHKSAGVRCSFAVHWR